VLTSTSGCVASTDTVIITVNPGPVVNAGTDKTVCANNANVTLAGFVFHATGGKWTTSGSGTFTPTDSTLNATYIPSTADTTAGNVFLVLTSKGNGSCSAVIDSMHVIFSPKPTVNAGLDQVVCKSALTSTLNGIVSGGATTGKWTTTGTGTFTPTDSTLNASYTPSTADTSAGTVKLVLTSTNNGGCNAVTDTITITYTNVPAINAGIDQSVCANNASVVLNGSVSTGTGTWSTNGDGTFSPNATTLNATYTPGVNDTASGTIVLTLTSSGGCSVASKSITITITPAPVVNAGTDQFICANNLTVTLNGNVNGGSTTGKWTTTGTGIFVPNDSTLNATYTMTTADTTAGNILMILTSSNNGNCSIVKDTMKVTYTSSPIAFAGNDAITCANNATPLSGTITGGAGTGIWTTTNGSGTFVPNNTTLNASYVPVAADTLIGTIKLVLTSTSGCVASTDTVIITVNPGPVVNAGTDKTVCSNNANVTLAGFVFHAAGGKWTTSGSGTFSPTDSTLNATYIPSTADTTAGNVFLVLTSKGNGSCSAVIDSMHVVFSPKPTVNAGLDQVVCKSALTSTLNGIVSGGATTGKWTTTGTGTFTPTDSTLNASYTPSTADTSAGIVKLILTSTNNGGCNAVTDTLTITYTNVPTVMAGADTTVCSSITTVQLNGGIIGGAGTGKWTTTGTGTFTPTDSTLNATYQPTAADLTSGSVKLILTSTHSCVVVTDTMILSFTPAPTANANVDQTICAGNIVTLNGIITIASNGQWTTTGTGTFNPNATTLNATYTPSAADITAGTVKILLTSIGNGTCNAAVDSLIITIQSKPVANFTNATPCLNAAVNFMDTSIGTITTWAWDFGNGTSTIQNPANMFTSTGNKTVTLIVSTSAGCADTVSKTIFVNPLPVASFTFLTFCPDSAEFTDVSTISPGSISSWSWSFGDSTISNLQNPKHTYSSAGTYVATLFVTSDSGCVASATDSVKVILCDNEPVIVNKAVVPSAFTPNHDGHNDILFVKGGPFKTLSFRIFNEWGNEIFNSSSQSDGWDGTFGGKAQPAGTYVWTVTGTTVDNIEIKMVGGVTLIR
jgi:gliding motility-associated-like protein